jgi:hypothetical protein
MPTSHPVIWAYTYKLTPPLSVAKLRDIKVLLASEQAAAKSRAGTWEARFVSDERISHILVLSDSPNLELDANRNLERALRNINAFYILTVPMIVADDPADPVPPKD